MTNPMQSSTLQESLNRLFRGYNMSDMGEFDEKVQRQEIFDDYLILTDIIKNLSEPE